MATLYLDRRGSELRWEAGTVRVTSAAGESRNYPATLVQRVVIHSDSTVSSRALTELASRGVPVIFISGGRPDIAVAVTGGKNGDAGRRLAQYRMAQDMNWRVRWAVRLLAAKLRGQVRFLTHAEQERPELASDLRRACREIGDCRDRMAECRGDTDLARIVGLEGAAARSYFGAFQKLFAPSLEFTGRNRRPPRDPVNVCLSLGYTIVHYQMAATLAAHGLDPYVGFLHEPDFGRESLAADLAELERVRVDAWVWEILRSRSLRVEHFQSRDGRCLLGKAGRQIFYTEFEEFMRALTRHQRAVCRLVVRALTGDSDGGELPVDETAVS